MNLYIENLLLSIFSQSSVRSYSAYCQTDTKANHGTNSRGDGHLHGATQQAGIQS